MKRDILYIFYSTPIVLFKPTYTVVVATPLNIFASLVSPIDALDSEA